MLLLSLLAGAQLVTPEAAVQRVAACGFAQVRARFDATLQEDVLEIGDQSAATDAQLGCAADASLATVYYLVMPEQLRARYDAIYRRHSGEQETAAARQWLAAKGMLSRLPHYAEGDDVGFARKLERFCGDRARGALDSKFGPHALAADWIARAGRSGDALECLINGAAAAGFELGFIGNAAPAE